MITFSDKKLEVLEPVGNGSYRYHWNIEETEIGKMKTENSSEEPENAEPRKQWSANYVTVWMPLNANKITEAVISSLWDANYEQKLINEYNAAQLGVYDEETAQRKVEAYRQFLADRQAVKEQVDEDWSKWEAEHAPKTEIGKA